MAQRRRKARPGRKVPKALGVLVQRLLGSPRARGVLVRALMHAAAVLVREHPKAALMTAGAGASSLAKGTAHAVAGKTKDKLRSAAQHLHLVHKDDDEQRERNG
ncbi:MAG TPA: hypothetical protein VHL31_10400 [Geminicoccus sp.]|jgi:hypothetical protein|uniref:hypothetical protein n=1 Tax=Geminicoccus sp. TaxID=2024832 RepID=UPI002E2EED4B|nr:hypothetical protein [Geminicoccus sp.]HEX2526691.1 hypothetical protein [Geminicoccus sp.]